MEKAKKVVTALYQQALKNQHCDVKITVHGKVYGAHRGVLVQASQYFKKLFSGSFKECHSGEVSFTEIVTDTEMFEAILEYIYLGNFDFEVHAPEDVLQVASLLLLDDLVKCCQQMLLERLTLDNALHTWSWAHLYDLKPLEEVCKALCRSRFHDTIIHQPDTMKLPVDFLCYIIKERVLDFVDETAKLTFLQCWLRQYTSKQVIKRREIMIEISSLLEEVEPNLATALQEPDFLSKHFQDTESPDEQVDCIVSVNDTESNTKTLTVCDLKAGKWYESSTITPPEGFSRYLAIAGRFVVFQNYKKDELYAFDNETKKGTYIFIPTYTFKGSQHIFTLGGVVYLFVTMSDYAIPSMDDWVCGTNTTERTRMDATGEGCSSHQKSMSPSCEGASVDPAKDIKANTQDEILQLPVSCIEDLKTLESQLLSVLEGCFIAEDHPIDLTLLNKCNIKHCLFRLHTECSYHQEKLSSSVCPKCLLPLNACSCDAHGISTNDSGMNFLPICQNSRPRWKLVSEEEGFAPNLVLNKYETREIGGKLYIMAYGTIKNSNNGECSAEGGEEEEKGPFWFCVKPLGDANQGAQVVRLPDPPEKRTQRSRGVNWSQIKLVKIKGCFGLRSFKSAVRYSIYFDASDWRWKWVPYKTGFDVVEDCLFKLESTPINLQIRPKGSSSSPRTGLFWYGGGHRYDYRSCCDYPHINQLWSYESEEEGWKELPPPPCGLGYSHWETSTISQSLLRSLDLIKPRMTFIDNKETGSEDDEGPFANHEFIAAEL